MKQSIGYTQTLNIMIVFIMIVFMFIFAMVNFYKAYKINNNIVSSIEKYEGYNNLSENDISVRLERLGYDDSSIYCYENNGGCTLVKTDTGSVSNASGERGYCVYYCDDGNNYYHYRVATNMFINVPIVRTIIPLKVYSSTETLYDFEKAMN